ncbi:MAG: PEP-CTERM sorting domain-containing protein [Phycisphaerae bacterium]|jgi:hypothetical protein
MRKITFAIAIAAVALFVASTANAATWLEFNQADGNWVSGNFSNLPLGSYQDYLVYGTATTRVPGDANNDHLEIRNGANATITSGTNARINGWLNIGGEHVNLNGVSGGGSGTQSKIYKPASSLTIQSGASLTFTVGTSNNRFKVAERYDATVNQYGNVDANLTSMSIGGGYLSPVVNSQADQTPYGPGYTFGDGQYNLVSGTLKVGSSFEIATQGSHSAMTQSGGRFEAKTKVQIGRNGGTGTFNMDGGTAKWTSTSSVILGDGSLGASLNSAAYNGDTSGTITQTDGLIQLETTWLTIGKGGQYGKGTGLVSISGGSFAINSTGNNASITIADSGANGLGTDGTLEVTGTGALTTNNFMQIGYVNSGAVLVKPTFNVGKDATVVLGRGIQTGNSTEASIKVGVEIASATDYSQITACTLGGNINLGTVSAKELAISTGSFLPYCTQTYSIIAVTAADSDNTGNFDTLTSDVDVPFDYALIDASGLVTTSAFRGGFASARGNYDVVSNITRLGDADCDGDVDSADQALVTSNWGQSGMTWFGGDFNNDGTVNDADQTVLDQNLGFVYIPEPATMTLLGLGGCLALIRRRSPK